MQTQFSPNPYDNQEFLAEQFQALSPDQQLALFLAVAEKYHRANCSREEMAGTVVRVNRQYERALDRIAALNRQVQELQQAEPEYAE